MRCRRSRRFISDKLDGALRPRLGRALEAHLERCPDCRAHERTLRRLDSGASRAGRLDFTPEAGEEFLRRLDRRLDQERQRAGSPVGKRWLWSAAGLTAVAVAVLAWVLVLRPVPSPDIYALSESDVFSRIIDQYSRDPGWETSFNDALLASIDDSTISREESYPTDPWDNPLLWEGVSREELNQLETEIASDAAI